LTPGEEERMTDQTATHDRPVKRPMGFATADWKAALWRVKDVVATHNLTLVAAGIAFYSMLALFPMIGALGAIYGFFADPSDIVRQMDFLDGIAPPQAIEIISAQATKVASTSSRALGIAALIGLAFALWSAKAGIGAAMTGMNIAYREEEKRSIVMILGTSFALTFALILVAAVALFVVVVAPAALSVLPLGMLTELLVNVLRWPVGLAAILFGIGLLYRYGPSRKGARVSWVTPGAIAAAALWLAGSAAFSWYVSNLASYNETYGPLGAVIGLLMWFYVSAFMVLIGAEINAELERQTSADTTTGPEKPMGQRGAVVADTCV
jgi:membrane protein